MATLTTPDISMSLFKAQASQQQATTSATSLISEADKTKMHTKAKEFESFFVYQTIELMKPNVDSEFTGGVGEDMFRHNLNEQMAKSITNAGGFGIADKVYGELLKQQEQRASSMAAAAKTYAQQP